MKINLLLVAGLCILITACQNHKNDSQTSFERLGLVPTNTISIINKLNDSWYICNRLFTGQPNSYTHEESCNETVKMPTTVGTEKAAEAEAK